MTPGGTPVAEFATVFNWKPPRSRKVSLLSFLAGSIVLHALCFYIFQIIYPPATAPPPPPARINIITPASEEGRILLAWVEAEDPALSSTTQRPPHVASFAPPNPEHVPSYANRQPALTPVPPYAPDLRVPSSRPPGPVPEVRGPIIATAPVVKTTVDFETEHGQLGAPQLPEFRFAPATKESPQTSRFRIGVSALGDVRYCFMEDSSGDSALDEQARRYLLLTRFGQSKTKSAGDLIWTAATIEWGNDIAPPPAANSSPAP
jgi:hypothetical protein